MPIEKPADHFFELVQRFIHLRPKLVVPENIARFKQQMQSIKLGSAPNQEDRTFPFRVFVALERNETPIAMGELSAELGIPLSSASRIVDGLVSESYIERIHDANDRRIVRIQMTKAGREMYQTIIDFNKQRVSRILNKFSPEEQTQLLYLMNKLFDSLTAEAETEKGVAQ